METINNNKTIAFNMSAFLAFGMFLFEVQKTRTIDIWQLEGTGHLLVLAGLGATGLTLFYLAGNLWAKNVNQASIIFCFSVALRAFVAYYIETLEAEQVFESGERWTMHAGNIALAFIEVAFAFTQTKGDATQKQLDDIHEDYRRKLDAAHQELNETKTQLNEQIEFISEELTQAKRKQDALEKTISANENALAAFSRIKKMFNKPQKWGTRWVAISNNGQVFKCDAEGNRLESLATG